MTEHDILDAIGDIDPMYLEEAKRRPLRGRIKWVSIGSLAACLALLLVFPLQYYLLNREENKDYAPKADQECAVYFVQDGALYYETVGVLGGDAEMFETWARKNGVTDVIDLKDISFSFTMIATDFFDVIVTVPMGLAHYFEGDDGALHSESLKRTIASYRNIEIGSLAVVYS